MHALEEGTKEVRTVPLRAAPSGVMAVAMVKDVMVVGTAEGRLLHLDCTTSNVVKDSLHHQAIRNVFPHPAGDRCLPSCHSSSMICFTKHLRPAATCSMF